MNKSGDWKGKALYLFVAVVFAVAMWVYVTYTNNDILESFTFRGVKINFVGAEKLADNDLVITNIDKDTINVNCSGRNNTLTSMNVGNINATVDLAEIVNTYKEGGVFQLSVHIGFDSTVKADSITVNDKSSHVVTVTVERRVSRQFNVVPVYNGGAAEGYKVADTEANIDMVTVSGSSQAISAIDHATVTLDRENLSKTVSEVAPIKLVGLDGEELPMDDLTLNADTAKVTVTIHMIKEVPLRVNMNYTLTATPNNTICNIEPSSITIVGDPEIVEGYNSITLTTVDLSRYPLTYEETMPIVIDNNLINASGIDKAKVSIEIVNVETFSLSVSNITARGQENFENVNIVTESTVVLLRGSAEDIAKIRADETHDYIRVVADLTGVDKNTTGGLDVPGRVYVDGYSNVEAVGDYHITVNVSGTTEN